MPTNPRTFRLGDATSSIPASALPCDEARPNAQARGYDSRWQRARKAFLAKHPLCDACGRMGLIRPATVVDHIVPHRGDKRLFWDRANWQPLCATCHNRKTRSGH